MRILVRTPRGVSECFVHRGFVIVRILMERGWIVYHGTVGSNLSKVCRFDYEDP
jgi:hypothetical protein